MLETIINTNLLEMSAMITAAFGSIDLSFFVNLIAALDLSSLMNLFAGSDIPVMMAGSGGSGGFHYVGVVAMATNEAFITVGEWVARSLGQGRWVVYCAQGVLWSGTAVSGYHAIKLACKKVFGS